MSRKAISGGLRRRQGQGASSIKEVLNSLAFLDKPGPDIAREQLPRAAQSVEGLVHELQCLDEVFRRWLVIFSLTWHPHSPDSEAAPAGGLGQTNSALTKRHDRASLVSGILSIYVGRRSGEKTADALYLFPLEIAVAGLAKRKTDIALASVGFRLAGFASANDLRRPLM
jgi:hypothetical protein